MSLKKKFAIPMQKLWVFEQKSVKYITKMP